MQYLISLTVSPLYHLSAIEKAFWKKSIEVGSEYIFNATKGQMQLSQIKLVDHQLPISETDVYLSDEPRTFGGQDYSYVAPPVWYCRTPDSEVISSYIVYRQPAKELPLIVAHELFHLVVGLADEYIPRSPNSSKIHTCTGDPSTGTCIMEFSRNSKQLEHDNGRIVFADQPNLIEVTQLCLPSDTTEPHTHFQETLSGHNNYQETQHCQSCWETLKKHFTKMVIPSTPSNSVVGTLDEIDWTESEPGKRLGFVIFSPNSEDLSDTFAINDVKSSLISVLQLASGSETEIGVFGLAPEPYLLPFNTVPDLTDPDQAEKFDRLVSSIRKLEAGNDKADNFDFGDRASYLAEDLFSIETRYLWISGDSKAEISDEQAEQLTDFFASQFVNLEVFSFGTGRMSRLISRLSQSKPCLTHYSLPSTDDRQLDSLLFQSIQNEIILQQSQGVELIEAASGWIPAVDTAQPDADEAAQAEADRDSAELFLRTFPAFEGFDIPVLVEQGVGEVQFMLTMPAGNLSLELIQPNGVPLERDNEKVIRSFDSRTSQWIKLGGPTLSGRWIVRVNRMDPNETWDKELGFAIHVAVVDIQLRLETNVTIENLNVVFDGYVRHGDHLLDFLSAQVDVFQLNEAQKIRRPLASLVLSKKKFVSCCGDKKTSISKFGLSSGVYENGLQLEPGTYMAEFRFANAGNAIRATHAKGMPEKNNDVRVSNEIEPFVRISREYFSIPEVDSSFSD